MAPDQADLKNIDQPKRYHEPGTRPGLKSIQWWRLQQCWRLVQQYEERFDFRYLWRSEEHILFIDVLVLRSTVSAIPGVPSAAPGTAFITKRGQIVIRVGAATRAWARMRRAESFGASMRHPR